MKFKAVIDRDGWYSILDARGARAEFLHAGETFEVEDGSLTRLGKDMKKDKYKPVRQALHVGQKLSNVAFNLVQKDDVLDLDQEDWQRWRQTLDELRGEWDAVAAEARRAVAPRRRKK